MKRAAFASLCGVSKQAISKHEAAGRVFVSGTEVDAGASLIALEGYLDENKRQRALTALRGGLVEPSTGGQPASGGRKTGKALKEDLDAEMRALDLAQRKGELVLASAVDARAREAVALLRESRAVRRREVASQLCATFGVAVEKVSAVSRFLAAEDEHGLGLFARALGRLITENEAGDVDEAAASLLEPGAGDAAAA